MPCTLDIFLVCLATSIPTGVAKCIIIRRLTIRKEVSNVTISARGIVKFIEPFRSLKEASLVIGTAIRFQIIQPVMKCCGESLIVLVCLVP